MFFAFYSGAGQDIYSGRGFPAELDHFTKGKAEYFDDANFNNFNFNLPVESSGLTNHVGGFPRTSTTYSDLKLSAFPSLLKYQHLP